MVQRRTPFVLAPCRGARAGFDTRSLRPIDDFGLQLKDGSFDPNFSRSVHLGDADAAAVCVCFRGTVFFCCTGQCDKGDHSSAYLHSRNPLLTVLVAAVAAVVVVVSRSRASSSCVCCVG
jgi:hypothetical protein